MSKKKELTVWEKGVLLEEIKHLDTIDKIEKFIKRNWELLYDSMEEENEKLKQQLAEKEKEAETYKREIVFLDKKINNLKEEIPEYYCAKMIDQFDKENI